MQACTTCAISKPFTSFHKNKKSPTGYRTICKDCSSNKRKERYATDSDYREKRIAKSILYTINNKDKVKKRTGLYIQNNYASFLLQSTKSRAKTTDVEHNITLEDIIIPDTCPYLEVPLTRIHGQGQLSTNASIDRIDNSKGYIKGNIQITSRLANTMKNQTTEEQLIQFAKSILAMEEA